MMRFEYNSDLDFDERVEFVFHEIKDAYPEIEDFLIRDISENTLPIDDKVSNDDKFDRYYLILRIIGRDHPSFSQVFNDLYNVYEDGLHNKVYLNVMPKIIDYANGSRSDFPELVSYE